MQATTTAFGQVIGSNDQVVEHSARILLPLIRTNRCPNPTFTYGYQLWTGVGGATFNLAAATTHVHSGQNALAIVLPTAGGGVAAAQFTNTDVPLGSVAAFAAWVYVPAGQPAMQLFIQSASMGAVLSAASAAPGAFTRLTVSATALDATVTFGVVTNGASTSGQTVWLDDVLVEYDPPTLFGSDFDGDDPSDINLCANPSFEQPLQTEWWPATNCAAAQDGSWSGVGDGDSSAGLTPTTASNDTYISAGGDSGGLRSGLVPGFTYTISATANVPGVMSGTAHARALRIAVFYKVGVTVTETDSPAAATTGATRVSVTVAIPSSATEAYVRLYNGYSNSAANLVQWDGVLIRQAATDTAYFGGRRISDRTWLGNPGWSESVLNYDPYPDLSLAMESVRIDRSLVTDMPDGTRLISGYPSASATIVMSGLVDQKDEAKTAAWLFGAYESTSPLYRRDLTDSPVQLQHGVWTAAGAELVTTFTGLIDEVTVDSVNGQVTITALDYRNKLRATQTLPALTALGGYWGVGLTGTAVMNYLLFQSGIYSGPPPRPRCFYYSSMCGTVWPEIVNVATATGVATFPNIGTAVATGFVATPPDVMATMKPGVWHEQVPFLPFVLGAPIDPSIGASVATGGSWFCEGWVALTTDPYWSTNILSDPITAAEGGGLLVGMNQSDVTLADDLLAVQWFYTAGNTSTTTAYFGLLRVGDSGGPMHWYSVALPSIPVDDQPRHLAIWVSFPTSTTANISVWLEGVLTTVTVTGLTASGAEKIPDSVFLECTGWVDAVQFTSEPNPTPTRAAYPGAMFDASLNAPAATVPINNQDSWSVMQQLAEAEAGIAGFDELGIFRFTNRRSLTPATSRRTITSTTHIDALSVNAAKASVANHVQTAVNVIRHTGQGGLVPVWETSETIRIGPHKTYSANVVPSQLFSLPVDNNAQIDYIPGGQGANPSAYFSSGFRASRSADGAGARVTTGVTAQVAAVDTNTLAVSITNNNPFTIYLVSPSVETDVGAGTPMLWIAAIPLVASTQVVDAAWPPLDEGGPLSTPQGETAITLNANPWLQDVNTAQSLADDILADLVRPRPQLSNFVIVADPRLQLGDRVTVLDDDGSKIADDFQIVRISFTDSDADYDQTVDTRAVAMPGQWIMGQAGRSEMGHTTYV